MKEHFITYENPNGLPPTICIELTKWCNLNCSFCRSGSSPKKDKEGIDFEEVSSYLMKLSQFGNWRISLTGGEPMFWPHIKNLVSLICDLGFSFSITTNGNYSPRVLDHFAKRSWELGTLKVSIDGDSSTHNFLRGAGGYEKSIELLAIARGIVPRLFVNTILVVDPKKWVKGLLTDLSLINPNNWSLISPIQSGSWGFDLDKLNEPNYREQYIWVKNIAKSSGYKMPISFLDYSNWNKEFQGIVYISSDGNVSFPRYFDGENSENAKSVHISNDGVVHKTYLAVSNFISKYGFIQ